MTLFNILQKHGYIKHSPDKPFTLSSGIESEWYFDIKSALLNGEVSSIISTRLLRKLPLRMDVRLDFIGGPELAAYAITHYLSNTLFWPKGFLVRKATKDHGLKSHIVGHIPTEGSSCLLVDDVLTTGESLAKVIDMVEEVGAVVCMILVVVDRKEGDCEKIKSYRERGLVHSVITRGEDF